ncbi:Amidohydrolase [uncultured archaeon]|nr:Amidohydrolase [uncultured archaeon]
MTAQTQATGDFMIDAHMHFGDFVYKGRNWSSYEEYVKAAESVGVKRFCAVPIGKHSDFANKSTPDNESILKLAKRDKRVIPVFWLNILDFSKKERSSLDQFFAVKLHPDLGEFAIDDPRVIRIVNDIDLPVFVHTNESKDHSSLQRMTNLAKRFPKKKFIAIHSGSVTRTFFKLHDYAIPDNLYFDVSGVQYELILKKLHSMVGADRMIFGSDYPFGDPRVALERIRVIARNKREFDRMTERNIAELLGL